MVSFFILCPIINLIHTSFAPALSMSEATLGKISGNLNQIAKRINSTGNVYEEDIAEVKAIMDEVWRTQKAMLKKQPLIHNG